MSELGRHLSHLSRDFELDVVERKTGGRAYSIGQFRAFTGQQDHQRHDLFAQHRSRIS